MPTGRNIGGSLANSFASGNVYNPWRGQYAPSGVTGTRMGLGAASQFGGPIGSLGAWIANKIYSGHNADAQHFDQQLATDNVIGPQRDAWNQQLMQNARQYQAQPSSGFVNVQNPITPMGDFGLRQPTPTAGGFMGGNTLSGYVREQVPIPMQNTQVGDVHQITSLGNVGYRDQSGAMHYTNSAQGGGWAGQAGGGASQGGGIGQGWTGVSGDAARGMFGGMRAGSESAMREAEMAAMRRMRQ